MAESVVVNESRDYAVGQSTEVFLRVVTGDAGQGGTSVIWDGQIIAVSPGQNARFNRNGNPVRGGILSCTTNVNAALQTIHTSVTYQLSGGLSPQQFTFQKNASEPGGQVTYFIDFCLVGAA